MALLQISEPGESPAPHERKLAVGIDLGTTHSLVAAVRSSIPEILPDAQGRRLLPSAVRYVDAQTVEVGVDALTHRASDPLNTLVSIKRLMGRSAAEAQADHVPYDFVGDESGLRIRTRRGEVTPVEVSAQILDVLRARAEAVLGDQLVGAVITVPAYFDDAQRQATRDAARLAGLNVLRLLNEPTAAAIAYGLDHAAEGVYAVYDLGGGTFDISILRLSKGVFEVIATGGDAALGGDDFDDVIADHVCRQWQLEVHSLEPGDRRAMMVAARTTREALTEASSAELTVQLSGRGELALNLTREAFEQLAAPLVTRTIDRARASVRDAGLKLSEIEGVVLVGGSTRMPVVQAAVEACFGSVPLRDIDPDEVVALGAALQANLLAGNRAPGEDWLLLDVTPLSLGLETMGGLVERIIPRNSTIPVARAQEFTTFKDGQTAMSIHVLQGERDLVSESRSLARFELRGMPALVAGSARIRVTFQVDADGLLSVTAREQSTGIEAAVSVKPSYGLSDDEVARMLADGVARADADAQARMLREQLVEARQLVISVEAALGADGDLLDATERKRIDECLVACRSADHAEDVDVVKRAVTALSDSTEAFAARRMDRGIRAALAGRKLNEIT
ncbi:MAG: Fe-S protein assembly chaperone HscA [Burkholderiaceae bacterium]|nr:Fe-S protein assembly chaperone HscA [Burkholderiaceae bacterium]